MTPAASPYAAYVVETTLTLVVVCGLALLVLWGGRRLGAGRPRGPLALRGHLALDARRAVYLVQVGPQVFVVGAADGGLTKLGELAAADLPAERSASTPSLPFAEVLARVRARARRTTDPNLTQPAKRDDT